MNCISEGGLRSGGEMIITLTPWADVMWPRTDNRGRIWGRRRVGSPLHSSLTQRARLIKISSDLIV